jgi:hypothetical protein
MGLSEKKKKFIGQNVIPHRTPSEEIRYAFLGPGSFILLFLNQNKLHVIDLKLDVKTELKRLKDEIKVLLYEYSERRKGNKR